MKLGLLSDTHGHRNRTQKALRLLEEAGADQLIHCGDVGGEDVLTLLYEKHLTGTPVHAVCGNVDEVDAGLILLSKKYGIPLRRLQRLELAGLKIALHHGHDAKIMQNLKADADLDILFTGHTHVACDEKAGQLRIINPGAVYRARPPGVSLFDLNTQTLQFLELDV